MKTKHIKCPACSGRGGHYDTEPCPSEWVNCKLCNSTGTYATKETYTKFKLGDLVRKTKGSEWTGRVVGTYSTDMTREGYCVESNVHVGSVQIYPAQALELWEPKTTHG